jgi:hypothetical protein
MPETTITRRTKHGCRRRAAGHNHEEVAESGE